MSPTATAPAEIASDFHRRPLANGHTLVEMTAYDGITLWWFVSSEARAIAEGRMPRWISPGGSLYGSLGTSRVLAAGYSMARVLVFVLSRLLVRGVGVEPDSPSRKVLILTQDRQWGLVADPVSGQPRHGDRFFGSIVESLHRRGYRIVTASPLTAGLPWYLPWTGLRISRERARTPGGPHHRPPEMSWSPEVLADGLRARSHFRRLWSNLQADGELRRLLGSSSGSEALYRRLSYFFVTVFPRVVEDITLAGRMLRRERPDLVLMLNEHGRWERAVVVASRRAGVPTLSLQHGIIGSGYRFLPGEISAAGDLRPPFCAIPDLTAVYGPLDQDLLVQGCNYPAEAVTVTGQPRYDSLNAPHYSSSRARVCTELKLDCTAPIVLWISDDNVMSSPETALTIETMARAFAAVKAQLVIKLHPNENPAAPTYRGMKPRPPRIVEGRRDIVEMLHASDVVITKQSTSALEAIGLGKPLIILNLSGQPDPLDCVREGVAAGVYRPADLEPALRRLLTGGDASPTRDSYIRQHLFRLDGKASERVADLVDRMTLHRAGGDPSIPRPWDGRREAPDEAPSARGDRARPSIGEREVAGTATGNPASRPGDPQ